MRVKFDRNMTGLTPVYILNSYKIPREDVDKFKKTLIGEDTFTIVGFIDTFIRLDNNNGIHVLG